METLRLTWDLTIIIFFAVVMAYTFIIGRNQAMKMVIAAYMALFTADGIGNLIEQYLVPASLTLQGPAGAQVLVLIKIITFVVAILLLSVKGGFRVDLLLERSIVTRILSNLSFGFLSAGLMVSILLVYLTGGSFIGGAELSQATSLYQESQLVQLMIDNYNIWFALPAISIVLVSFFEPREE